MKHYKQDIEAIAVMEQVMAQAGELPAKERMLVAQALKYLLRAGVKAGVPWQDDLLKALDYVHRAVKGSWYHSQAAPDDARPPEEVDDLYRRAVDLRAQADDLELQADELIIGKSRPCGHGQLVQLRDNCEVSGPARPFVSCGDWYIEADGYTAKANRWIVL